MRIEFTRSGGFAGLRIHRVLDTSAMDDGSARQLKALVSACDFFNLPPIAKPPGADPFHADRFQFKITVLDEGKEHTVVAGEQAATPQLSNLVKYLMAAARATS